MALSYSTPKGEMNNKTIFILAEKGLLMSMDTPPEKQSRAWQILNPPVYFCYNVMQFYIEGGMINSPLQKTSCLKHSRDTQRSLPVVGREAV